MINKHTTTRARASQRNLISKQQQQKAYLRRKKNLLILFFFIKYFSCVCFQMFGAFVLVQSSDGVYVKNNLKESILFHLVEKGGV